MKNIQVTYRYVLKLKKGEKNELFVRFLTATPVQHEKYRSNLLNDNNVVSCIAEYVCTYEFDFIGEIIHVKTEKKEGESDEEIR